MGRTAEALFWEEIARGVDPSPVAPLGLERAFPALHPKQRIAFASQATELLYGGAAGGGKSLLIRWCSSVWCDRIPGLQVYIFRRTYPELKANHLRGRFNFNELLAPWIQRKQVRIIGDREIRFRHNGSAIHLCHAANEDDVIAYDGAEIHFLILDEATTFTDYQFRYLRSRVRLGGLEIPDEWADLFPRIMLASNPGGIGHNWVMSAFQPMSEPWRLRPQTAAEGGGVRQYIPAQLEDNPTMEAGYENRLMGMGDAALVAAKRRGDWNIVAGGMFDDVCMPFDGETEGPYLVEPFAIPNSWRIDRSFDWGSSEPYACLWWAESDGTDVVVGGQRRSFRRGTLFLIAERYGWNGEPNQGVKHTAHQVARVIRRDEEEMGLIGRVQAGPADTQIYIESNGNSLAADMAQVGVRWTEADKSPGTRKLGWLELRKRLAATREPHPETPGLYVFTTCPQWRRTVPALERHHRDPEEIADGQEDHLGDATRYRILTTPARRRAQGRPKVVQG